MKHGMKKTAEGGGIREGKARFSDDIRERARTAIAARLKKSSSTAQATPVKPPSKIEARELSDAGFKTDLEDRMGIQRGSLPRKQATSKNGGAVKKMANGGSVSKRADGIAQRGKTKGRMI
jgi:hypothetical protein